MKTIDATIVSKFFTGTQAERDVIAAIYPEFDPKNLLTGIQTDRQQIENNLMLDISKWVKGDETVKSRMVDAHPGVDFRHVASDVFMSVIAESKGLAFHVYDKMYQLVDLANYEVFQRHPDKL